MAFTPATSNDKAEKRSSVEDPFSGGDDVHSQDEEDDMEEVEVEEEIEESDDDGANTDTPAHAMGTGKVHPSDSVKMMKMSSPELLASSSDTLDPDVNPFTTMGDWTRNKFSQVHVNIPAFTPKSESTNPRTRENRPDARYWKQPITFSFGNFTSHRIRIHNVKIPYADYEKYGNSYIYMCLPGYMADAFQEAGRERSRPTVTGENTLISDEERWWKIANGVDGKIGSLNKQTDKFHPIDLKAALEQSGKGVILNVVLEFYAKANTPDRRELRRSDPQKISVEIVRGWVEKVDCDIQPPRRKEKPTARKSDKVVAIPADYASDDLLRRLRELGV